jgi:hypothetical protein
LWQGLAAVLQLLRCQWLEAPGLLESPVVLLLVVMRLAAV